MTEPHLDPSLDALATIVAAGRVAVLTGAGISTESGIPDYRGEGTRRRARNPIQYKEFLRDPATRRRYWARSLVGWPRLDGAMPNRGHTAMAAMERQGLFTGLVTQNVDRLHSKAGSPAPVELHGAMAEVICLDCGDVSPRDVLQRRLLELNPEAGRRLHHPTRPDHADPAAGLPGMPRTAPDGDADLSPEEVADFEVAACERCHGVLKPHVVFFGESVPKDRVSRAMTMVDDARCLLVAGSSLAIYSGYRFVRRAKARGIPVVILNQGETRGDGDAALRLEAGLGTVLPALAQRLR